MTAQVAILKTPSYALSETNHINSTPAINATPIQNNIMKNTVIKSTTVCALALSVATLLFPASVHADTFGGGGNQFTLPFVPIGNAANANDPFTSNLYGGVSYDYNMSVTAVSQTMLANAATLSGNNLGGGFWAGSKPAAAVSWYQAAAFVNWLNTSSGFTAAYNLTFTGNNPTGLTLWTGGNIWTLGGSNPFRNANAHYFLPSESEWYKAAYYDPNKAGGAGYWQYATGSNTAPTAVSSGTTAGTAVYNDAASSPAAVDQSGGLSPYGTQGQNGNVFQWTETDFFDPTNSSDGNRAVCGGAWHSPASDLQSSTIFNETPTYSTYDVGFRVASVPEPTSAALLGLGTLLLTARRRRSA